MNLRSHMVRAVHPEKGVQKANGDKHHPGREVIHG